MGIKRLIAILLIVSTFTCFVGCNNEQAHVVTDPSSGSIGNDEPTINMDAAGNHSDDVNNDEQKIVKNNEMIWEKEETQITLSTLKISQNWNESIFVDGAVVSAVDYTDMSVINNYYYGENDSYADLETAYYVPTYRLATTTQQTDLDTYISALMNIICTTNNTDENKHVIIEAVNFITTINPYEGGGINTLRAKAPYTSDGYFGIGNNHNYVTNIIGEANSQTTVSMDENTNLTTCTYLSENAEMILTFIWESNSDVGSAALVSIDWIATKIGSELHTQDGVELFEQYLDTRYDTSFNDASDIT